MSRITKDLAEQIAKKLTAKSEAEAQRLKKDYEDLVTDLYEAQIPAAVKETFAKHPEWFYTRRTIQFSGHGFRWESVTASQPIICNTGSDAHLKLTDKIATRITTAKAKWEKAQKAHKDLKTETENALLALRTYKQIEEHIPAAKPFLPPPMSNALVVNFDSLKKRLEKQPEIKITQTA